MACVSPRRGKWIVNYRDAAGKQRQPSFRTKRAAQDFHATVIQSRGKAAPVVDSEVTVQAYSERWLRQVKAILKPATVDSYSNGLRLHILPVFGAWKIRELQRGRIKAFLTAMLERKSGGTVKILHATIRAMLNAAIDDGLIHSNPALRLGRTLRLGKAKATRQEEIKALDAEQIAKLLSAAQQRTRAHYALFFTMARTGMRISEALALRWDDVDLGRREIRVARSVDAWGRVDTPKSGHGRTVDMSEGLASVLSSHLAKLQAKWMRQPLKRDQPKGDLPELVFPSRTWGFLDHSNIQKQFKNALRAAGLPDHFSPHSCRHSFASLLLQAGESVVYVQRQLGHSSIQLTVDTYGKWLPMGNKAAVDRLDTGGSLVATGNSSGKERR